ncbi:UNVERIFIED_CONTAM: hypothetical protein FO487_21565 [Bacillus amyloliquefaciens DSM 7 = ATCC 23350]
MYKNSDAGARDSLFSPAKTQKAFSSALIHGKEDKKRHPAIQLALCSFMLQSPLVSNHRASF